MVRYSISHKKPEELSTTPTSLIKGHVCLSIFRKKIRLPAVIKAYLFIRFKENIQPTRLLEAYPLIKFSSFFLAFSFL
jgi:hypothetical protein